VTLPHGRGSVLPGMLDYADEEVCAVALSVCFHEWIFTF